MRAPVSRALVSQVDAGSEPSSMDVRYDREIPIPTCVSATVTEAAPHLLHPGHPLDDPGGHLLLRPSPAPRDISPQRSARSPSYLSSFLTLPETRQRSMSSKGFN